MPRSQSGLRFLTVGALTIDEILSSLSGERITSGGAAFYGALAARVLGADVTIASSIGSDYPRESLEWMTSKGVDVGQVKVDPSSMSCRFRLEYDHTGRRRILLINRGPQVRVSESLFSKCEVAHIASVFHEVDQSTIAAARRRARLVGLEVQGFVRRVAGSRRVLLRTSQLDPVLGISHIIKTSLEEARIMTGKGSIRSIAQSLIEKGPDFALVGLGSRGHVLASRDEIITVPSYPETDLLDPTGAGDTMFAAWLVIYYRTRDAAWASAVGNGLASMIIRYPDRRRFRISRAELFRRAAWIYERVSIA